MARENLMARPLRLESEGGIYHVLNRGNYRSDLATSGKSADWKIAIAAALKAHDCDESLACDDPAYGHPP